MNGLNHNKDNLIKLVQNVFLGETNELNELNLDEIYALARFHSIEYIIYTALNNYNLDINDDFKKRSEINAYKSITQELELPNLEKLFSDNNICFLPLKGAIIQKMYPKVEYRNMADIDILLKKEDLKKAGKLVQRVGFSVDTVGGNHDTYTKKPYVHIELHRAMIGDCYEIASYYDDIWSSSKIYQDKNDEYHYYLTDDDYYIFMICHAAKHFSGGGTGFRTIIDAYIYLKEKKDLDFDYINQELKGLKLDKFDKLLKESVDYIFYHKEIDINDKEDVLFFIDYIINSGTYGNSLNSSTRDIVKEGSKKKHIFRRLFPTYKMMSSRNPILKKVPILLPWFYFTRLLKGIFHFKENKKRYDTIVNVNEDDIKRINKIKEITGVE